MCRNYYYYIIIIIIITIITELGPNWSPAIANTADELMNIRQGHLIISETDINPYWIGGSSDTERFIQYTEYRTDDNGK